MRRGIALAATALLALSCEVVAENGAAGGADCGRERGVCWDGSGGCPTGLEERTELDCAAGGSGVCCVFVEEVAGAPFDCPERTDPSARYVGEGPEVCEAIDYLCPAGAEPFVSDCGCGCVAPKGTEHL
jgi:hypothetical protein